MMTPAHIQVGENSTLCKLPLSKHHGCNCEYPTTREAKEAAKTLRPYFKRGIIKVVSGSCPNFAE